jgi:hypothetical protein
MKKYRYKVDDPDFDRKAFEFQTPSEYLRHVAQDAANDYYQKHDGWEAIWPCGFYIFDTEGNLLGVFTVEREYDPVFSVIKKTSEEKK